MPTIKPATSCRGGRARKNRAEGFFFRIDQPSTVAIQRKAEDFPSPHSICGEPAPLQRAIGAGRIPMSRPSGRSEWDCMRMGGVGAGSFLIGRTIQPVRRKTASAALGRRYPAYFPRRKGRGLHGKSRFGTVGRISLQPLQGPALRAKALHGTFISDFERFRTLLQRDPRRAGRNHYGSDGKAD